MGKRSFPLKVFGQAFFKKLVWFGAKLQGLHAFKRVFEGVQNAQHRPERSVDFAIAPHP